MTIAIPPLEATCHSLNGWWSLTLILSFFIGKELRAIRKEGDLQDEEKKNI